MIEVGLTIKKWLPLVILRKTARQKYGKSVISGHSNLYLKQQDLYLLLLDGQNGDLVYYSHSPSGLPEGLKELEKYIDSQEK